MENLPNDGEEHREMEVTSLPPSPVEAIATAARTVAVSGSDVSFGGELKAEMDALCECHRKELQKVFANWIETHDCWQQTSYEVIREKSAPSQALAALVEEGARSQGEVAKISLTPLHHLSVGRPGLIETESSPVDMAAEAEMTSRQARLELPAMQCSLRASADLGESAVSVWISDAESPLPSDVQEIAEHECSPLICSELQGLRSSPAASSSPGQRLRQMHASSFAWLPGTKRALSGDFEREKEPSAQSTPCQLNALPTPARSAATRTPPEGHPNITKRPVPPTRFSTNCLPAEEATKQSMVKRAQTKRRGGITRHDSPLAKRKAAQLQAHRSRLARLTKSRMYEVFNGVAIVLNAFFIIWETERRAALIAQSGASLVVVRGEFSVNLVSDIFCLIFLVDLMLRVLAERSSFFCSRDYRWNIFDIFVVVTACLETIAHWEQYASPEASGASGFRTLMGKFSMLRIVRLLRAIRVSRALRISRFFRELRVMVYSLAASTKSLAWSIVLLLIILLIFGVFFTDGTVAYCVRHGPDQASSRTLRDYFGSLSGATVSLFMAMSGGQDWIDIYEALSPLPSEYKFAFLAFVTFAILALLNVVTAVFVETAMQRSQNDRELLVQQEMEQKVEFVETLQRVFEELDSNGSGTLTLDEFEQQIQDEHILTYLSTLELDIDQVRILLTLLDLDQNGEVDIEEFITGCLRLKGRAKSLDMAILQYQIEWILHNLSSLTDSISQGFNGVMSELHGSFIVPPNTN